MNTIDLTSINSNNNFLDTGKDLEIIIGKILKNQELLKLLYYNDSDALTKPDITDKETIVKIIKNNVRRSPRIEVPEENNSYIIISFDGFSPNMNNPEYRDNLIIFDVLCPIETWENLGSYLVRPLLILHHLSAMFHKQKLSGIGNAMFYNAELMNLGPYAGYQMTFQVVNRD